MCIYLLLIVLKISGNIYKQRSSSLLNISQSKRISSLFSPEHCFVTLLSSFEETRQPSVTHMAAVVVSLNIHRIENPFK